MKNLFEFATTAPNIREQENKVPMVKLVYESTQPIKDTQKDCGRQLGLSDSDQDVKRFKKSFKKIVQDSEEEEVDIQTTPAKICTNDKCKTGLSIEWKSWENGCLCFGCWEYYSKFGSFINYKKEIKPMKAKNFNFLKSPRQIARIESPQTPEKHENSSPIQRESLDGNGYYSGRRKRIVSAKRNYKESSSDDLQDDGKKRQKSSRKIKENSQTISMEKNDKTLLVRNSLVWALFKDKGNYYSAIVVSVQENTVDVLFFQGLVGHDLPIGNYQLEKTEVKFLDLETQHKIFMDHKGQKEEFMVSEALSDGALLLIQNSKDENLIIGTRHGVYMDERVMSNNLHLSLIKKNKAIYHQIFENIYIIFSISFEGEISKEQELEMEEIKKSFIYRGGQIFGIGDNIPENCKVYCISNLPNKGTVFLSCLAKKIPIISLGWLQLCVKHGILLDPLSYTISSGLSDLIQETAFPVSRYIHQNLETDRVFEDKLFKLNGTETFIEKWKFILECGGGTIVSTDDGFPINEESETWLEQCLVHQYYFGYFRKGCQFDANLFTVNNKPGFKV